jgi:hypothetical protein
MVEFGGVEEFCCNFVLLVSEGNVAKVLIDFF